MTRDHLNQLVFERTNYQVEQGPFAGLKITPHNTWGDDDIGSKLLGCYEHVLHSCIEDIIRRQPARVINIGCADGYYALGMSLRVPNADVYGCDIHVAAENALLANAKLNGTMKERVSYVNNIHHETLGELIVPNSVIIVDCEGFEMELLEPSKVPRFADATILVECHDFIGQPITQTLMQRFGHTHDITNITETDIASVPWLSDEDARVLLNEHRPVKMNWLYMVPQLH